MKVRCMFFGHIFERTDGGKLVCIRCGYEYDDLLDHFDRWD